MKDTFPSILTNLLLVAAAASRMQAQSFTQPANPSAAPADLVNAFHAAFGDHHARAVRTKGIILEGSFIPDEQAATLTKASHLQKEPSLVAPRFSDFTGLPEIPDNISAARQRGLAIKFILPGGANTDVVCHSFSGLPRVMASAQMRSITGGVGSRIACRRSSSTSAPASTTPLSVCQATSSRLCTVAR